MYNNDVFSVVAYNKVMMMISSPSNTTLLHSPVGKEATFTYKQNEALRFLTTFSTPTFLIIWILQPSCLKIPFV